MTRARLRLLPALAIALPLLAAAEQLPPLEELMDPATYEAAGLERLSAAERAALRVWLEAWREGRAPAPVAAPSEPARPVPPAPVPAAPAAPSGPAAPPAPAVAELREQVREEVREEVRAEVRAEVREEIAAKEEQAAEEDVAEEEEQRSGWRGLFGGRDEQDDEPEGFRSRIDGRFSGWDGRTLFLLENGQIWQQRREDLFRYEAVNPEVVLERNRFGFWSMEVPEAGRTVLVKRVR